jgi:hypothetical protein
LGEILHNCLITLQQYAWKGNQEEKIEKGHKPKNCPNKIPFDSLFGCLLKVKMKGVSYGNSK